MKKFLVSAILFLFCFQPLHLAEASSLAVRLSGYILLQVEENGEAWYINPADQIRYYLGRPEDAFGVMRKLGIGISNENLNKIPIADLDSNQTSIDLAFANRHKGKIFLQVEENGEAWYVNPKDGKRYFLGRPHDAFSIMRNLGLGISNSDIAKIRMDVGNYSEAEASFLRETEQIIHQLVNEERVKAGLPKLSWNEEIAQVAREHSESLARENTELIRIGSSCDFPFIHHEGFDFGLYHSDRLENRSLRYFDRSAENIALTPFLTVWVSYDSREDKENKVDSCNYRRDAFEKTFEEAVLAETDAEKKALIVRAEIEKRKEALSEEVNLVVTDKIWKSAREAAEISVDGWMNSPGHRANILSPHYNQGGIGASSVNGYLMATQLFINRVY